MVSSELSFSTIVADLHDRLGRAPRTDAVMGGNDLFGIAAQHAAQRRGMQVPR